MNVIILRCVGVAVLLAGLILVINPELVSRKPVPSDTFEAVERRIWWGLIIGAGLLLLFHHQLLPWLTTFAAAASSLMFGLLVARLIGIALDGAVIRQWVNVGIELILLAPLVWWYLHLRKM